MRLEQISQRIREVGWALNAHSADKPDCSLRLWVLATLADVMFALSSLLDVRRF